MIVKRRLYDIQGHTYVMEFSWKSTPEDWVRHDLPDGHPMKTMFNHSDEDGSRPTWIDVKCAEASEVWGSDGASKGYWFAVEGALHNAPDTDDFNKAELLFKVAVKWDGCAHWDFAPTHEGRGDGYIHTCGPDLNFLSAFRTAYEEAANFMREAGTWDHD